MICRYIIQYHRLPSSKCLITIILYNRYDIKIATRNHIKITTPIFTHHYTQQYHILDIYHIIYTHIQSQAQPISSLSRIRIIVCTKLQPGTKYNILNTKSINQYIYKSILEIRYTHSYIYIAMTTRLCHF